ncbi:MAG: hypothetical protein D6738_01770 [Acidobacteria bacterium]|nr:MAG: hypothetical protein D6738_01770 [Acidobacteriota bacterium]
MHRDEIVPTLLAASYGFLVIGAYLALKAARDSIFLTRLGPERLPLVTIGIALMVGVFVGGYLRAARRFDTGRLVALSLLFFASHLGLFWWAARADAAWLPWAFYLWVGCFGIIAPVQLWTLVNEVFTIRQAKRLLPWIGAGGILGATVAGQAVGLAAHRVGTIGLIGVSAGVLAACAALAVALAAQRTASRHARRDDVRSGGGLAASVRRIVRSRHLAMLAGLVWISGVGTTLVDWQFKSVASGTLQGDALTAFFGSVYGFMALASLLVQLLLVRTVLHGLGFRWSITILPLALLVGTAAFLAAGTLAAVVAMRFGDGAFKHSIDRSARELAYMHLPSRLRVRVKSAIDMVLDRLGDGTGGLVLLALIVAGAGTPRIVGLVNVVILGGWLALAIGLGRNYRRELETAIADHRGGEDWTPESLDDPDARRALRTALAADDRRTLLGALELAGRHAPGVFRDEFVRLARSGDAEIRALAAGLLLRETDGELPDGLPSHLGSGDRALLAAAFEVMLAPDANAARARAVALLDGLSPAAAAARLALLFRRLGDDLAPVSERIMDVLSARAAPRDVRRALAAALGLAPGDPRSTARLRVMFEDEDAEVRGEAIASAGQLRDGSLAPLLLRFVDDPAHAAAAREALVALGDRAVPHLEQALRGGDEHPAPAESAALVLGAIGSARALDALLRVLEDPRGEVRSAVLLALVAAQRRDPALPVFDSKRALPALHAEADRWEDLDRLEQALRSLGRDREVELLERAAAESVGAIRERVFRLLELRFGSTRILRAERQIIGGGPAARDAALELVDDLLPRRIAARLVPLIEASTRPAAPRPRLVPSAVDTTELLARLAADADPWVAACALGVAARLERADARVRIARAALADGPAAVRDQATQVLVGDEAPIGNSTASPVERVLSLRGTALFSAARTGDLAHLATAARERTFRPGESILVEGRDDAPLVVITAGRAGVRRGGEDVETLGPGATLGARSALGEVPAHSGAVALGRVEALVVEREALAAVLSRRPRLAATLISRLAAGLPDHLSATEVTDDPHVRDGRHGPGAVDRGRGDVPEA